MVERFCEKNNLTFIVRAHQIVDDGYECFGAQVATIYSTPCHCERTNKAAVLVVGTDGQDLNLNPHKFTRENVLQYKANLS